MSPQRKAKILSSLAAGNQIRRFWNGPNVGGYLSHRLEGVKNLRESEVDALVAEGFLEFVTGSYVGRYANLRLKDSVSLSQIAPCRGGSYHVFTLGADKCSVCGVSR